MGLVLDGSGTTAETALVSSPTGAEFSRSAALDSPDISSAKTGRQKNARPNPSLERERILG
ncbi:MAG: hypothetical protein EBS53_12605 [Bacteroidetes bacterium]|nr:hypothetical protein [Bacteroidota bacterium]